MNQSILKIARAAIGITIVVVLALTVRGWWTEYKSAPPAKPAAAGAEATTPSAQDDSSSEMQVVDAEGTLIVLTDGLNLRAKPAIDGDQIRALNKKEKLTLLKKQGDWYYVSTSKEEEGWISANKSYTKLQK